MVAAARSRDTEKMLNVAYKYFLLTKEFYQKDKSDASLNNVVTGAIKIAAHLLKNEADQDEIAKATLNILVMDGCLKLSAINFQENDFREAERNCQLSLDVALELKKDDTMIEMLKRTGMGLEEYITAIKYKLRAIEEKQLELYDPAYRTLVKTESQEINPNLPCPCGSGKKYQFCCGRR